MMTPLTKKYIYEMNSETGVMLTQLSNIPASPAYRVYISQLIPCSRVCVKYSDFLDISKLMTQNLPKQGYVTPRLRLSLQIFYGRYHNRVDRCEISIPQMTMDHLLFTYMFSFLDLSLPRHLPDLTVYMSNMAGVLLEAGTVYPSRVPDFTSGFLVGSILFIFSVVYVVLLRS
jgi:hypothetical protein